MVNLDLPRLTYQPGLTAKKQQNAPFKTFGAKARKAKEDEALAVDPDQEHAPSSFGPSVTFPLTQVGEIQVQYVAVYNPTSLPLHVQLLALDDDPNVYLGSAASYSQSASQSQGAFTAAAQYSRVSSDPSGQWWNIDLPAVNYGSGRGGHTSAGGGGPNDPLSKEAKHAARLGSELAATLNKNIETAASHKLDSNPLSSPGQSRGAMGAFGTEAAFYLPPEAAHHVTIPAAAQAYLGPILFRPPKAGKFESTLYMRNNLTRFTEVRKGGNGGAVAVVAGAAPSLLRRVSLRLTPLCVALLRPASPRLAAPPRLASSPDPLLASPNPVSSHLVSPHPTSPPSPPPSL